MVNLDWDHVKAVDLFKIFNGFKPDGSIIRSVRVYPSEFGKERMAKEEAEGPPKEIFKKGRDGNDSAEEDVNEKTIVKVDNGEEFDMNALRRYQLDRLKYVFLSSSRITFRATISLTSRFHIQILLRPSRLRYRGDRAGHLSGMRWR